MIKKPDWICWFTLFKVNGLEEGLKSTCIHNWRIFNTNTPNELSQTDTVLLTTMYVFYAKCSMESMSTKTNEIGWFLPRKTFSYENLLDSILADPKLF
jgi:hypothetical protein